MNELASKAEPNGSVQDVHEQQYEELPDPSVLSGPAPIGQIQFIAPREHFIDIGWALIRAKDITICGIWAEEDNKGRSESERPYVRVKGESFAVTHEELLYIQHALGYQHPPTSLHDKYAALVDENSCFNKAHFGEPLFIVRAQDEFSAELVRTWADKMEAAGSSSPKIAEARQLADLMEQYPGRKIPD